MGIAHDCRFRSVRHMREEVRNYRKDPQEVQQIKSREQANELNTSSSTYPQQLLLYWLRAIP